jgi:hypothetical protein
VPNPALASGAIASNQGKAMAVPRPLSTVRRDNLGARGMVWFLGVDGATIWNQFGQE